MFQFHMNKLRVMSKTFKLVSLFLTLSYLSVYVSAGLCEDLYVDYAVEWQNKTVSVSGGVFLSFQPVCSSGKLAELVDNQMVKECFSSLVTAYATTSICCQLNTCYASPFLPDFGSSTCLMLFKTNLIYPQTISTIFKEIGTYINSRSPDEIVLEAAAFDITQNALSVVTGLPNNSTPKAACLYNGGVMNWNGQGYAAELDFTNWPGIYAAIGSISFLTVMLVLTWINTAVTAAKNIYSGYEAVQQIELIGYTTGQIAGRVSSGAIQNELEGLLESGITGGDISSDGSVNILHVDSITDGIAQIGIGGIVAYSFLSQFDEFGKWDIPGQKPFTNGQSLSNFIYS